MSFYQTRKEKRRERKRQERLNVVRSVSGGRRSSLVDNLKFARDVIIKNEDEMKKERLRGEKLKVIHSGARRGSLVEQLEFAKTTIRPSKEQSKKDHHAYAKRQVYNP